MYDKIYVLHKNNAVTAAQMGDFTMHFYPRIRDLREDNDKNQTDIAEILGMKYQQYARYETGEREIPLHHLITLARYYNVSLDYLAGLIDTPRKLH